MMRRYVVFLRKALCRLSHLDAPPGKGRALAYRSASWA